MMGGMIEELIERQTIALEKIATTMEDMSGETIKIRQRLSRIHECLKK